MSVNAESDTPATPATPTAPAAVVTGGGRGIGLAISRRLIEAGWFVYAAGRTAGPLEALAAEVGEDRLAPVIADVSVEADVAALFRRVADDGRRLELLVNNAGLGLYGPIAEMSVEDFDRVLAVNLRGAFLCCREALALMTPASAGFIINISSVVGFKGYPNQGAYTASKHGLMGLTKTLAVEAAAHGIRVSAILPGGVDTEMVAAARPDLDRSQLIRPEDIAATVSYLLSLSPTAHVDQIYIRRRSAQPF